MTESAYRYAWLAPADGVALRVRRWTAKGAGLKGLAVPLKKPQKVFVARKIGPRGEVDLMVVEPTPKERSLLVRELDRLDPEDTDALAEYMTRWGFLAAMPRGDLYRFRQMDADHRKTFLPVDEPPDDEAFKIESEYYLVDYMRLNSAQSDLGIYQAALGRAADLSTLRGAARREAVQELRDFILDRLHTHATGARDPETFLPMIGSPLETAWQRLAEQVVGGQVPVRCRYSPCGRPFSLAETDKRSSTPPRFCSDKCRQAAHRKRKRSGKAGKTHGRQ